MLRMFFVTVFAIVTSLLYVVPVAAQTDIHDSNQFLTCQLPAIANVEGCLLRMPADYRDSRIQATKLNGDPYSQAWRLLDADEIEGDIALSGTIVLIDVTLGAGSGRRATFERYEKPAIMEVVRNFPSEERVAVYTFDTKIKELSGFGASRDVALRAIDGIKLTGTNTWIGSSIADAMRVLQADKRSLLKSVLLVSDGLDESGLSVDDIIRDADASRISISALGAFWQTKGSPDIGKGGAFLNRLSERTNGEIRLVNLHDSNLDNSVRTFVERLAAVREEDRLITLKDGEQAEASRITITAKRPLFNGSADTELVRISADFVPAQPSGISAAEGDTSEATDPKVEAIKKILALAKEYWWGVAAALAVLLIVLLAIVLRRKRSDDDEFDTGDDMESKENSAGIDFEDRDAGKVTVGGREVTVRAMLVHVDSGRQMHLQAGRNSIGRGPRNDITIPDDGISRAHASIQNDGNGGFMISDMQTTNGTFVNGRRIVDTQRIGIGDAIMLGNYKMVLQKA